MQCETFDCFRFDGCDIRGRLIQLFQHVFIEGTDFGNRTDKVEAVELFVGDLSFIFGIETDGVRIFQEVHDSFAAEVVAALFEQFYADHPVNVQEQHIGK